MSSSQMMSMVETVARTGSRKVAMREQHTNNQHDSQTKTIESNRSKLESNGSIGENRTTPNRDHDAISSDFLSDLASWSRFGVAKTKRGPTGARFFDIFVPLNLKNGLIAPRVGMLLHCTCTRSTVPPNWNTHERYYCMYCTTVFEQHCYGTPPSSLT